MASDRHLNQLTANLMKALQNNEGAECSQMPDIFFPSGESMMMFESEIRFAKSICNVCPLIAECLELAVEAQEPFGIWGGTTPAERNRISQRRKQKTL